jgi:hypothetical protein
MTDRSGEPVPPTARADRGSRYDGGAGCRSAGGRGGERPSDRPERPAAEGVGQAPRLDDPGQDRGRAQSGGHHHRVPAADRMV